MMPAISLTPLPPLPPFQFMPEADLNFGAVLEAVPAQVPAAPAQAPRALPDQALLSFLGMNPVKAQPIAPESAAIEDETLDDEAPVSTDPFSREGLGITVSPQVSNTPPSQPFGLSSLKPSPPFNLEEKGNTSTATRREPVLPESGATGSPEVSYSPPPKPFGLSLSKPPLPFNLEEKGSTSTSSVRTELGVSISPQIIEDVLTPTPLHSGELRDSANTPSQPAPTTPPTDPLRFVVDRQLDLARDSRWLDALARDIVAVADAPDRLSFRLSPPQLGRLDIDLSASENGLSVRMNASTEAATQIIAAAQPRLIDELKSQGVRVAEAQVSTSSGGQSQGQNQQQQRDADQMIEFVRQRIERNNETNLTRPGGRFA